MREDFVFLITHLGSGYNLLLESLNQYPHIRCVRTDKTYTHPTDLYYLRDTDHCAKTYLDTILFNHSLTSVAFYKFCRFIYLIRDFEGSLGEMKGYSNESAANYYLFRLRRMYEIAYYTPGSLFLTYHDLSSDHVTEILQYFFKLKSAPRIKIKKNPRQSDAGYEKYLSMFKRLDLQNLNFKNPR